ncbi:MAG TPA: hypothetical protein VFE57_03445 [Cyclobacteriaceae bacterium]|nr:hypothetical protein [Cyclobacteriaceae bacterium]
MVDLTPLQSTPTLLIVILIFIVLIALYVLGHKLRSTTLKNNRDRLTIDLGTINGTLLGLLGLLLAFTFGMASSRYDARRELIIAEANDIGTVILRTDIYPDSVRDALRSQLKAYVEERIAFYEVGMKVDQAMIHYVKADSIGKKVWSIVATHARSSNMMTLTSTMIPALNDMIDITTTRRATSESTVPDAIMYFLFALCFCSAFLLGYDNKNRRVDWIVLIGFATMLSVTVYMIIDLDRPRSGLINMDKPHEKIVELRDMFK